MHLNLCMVLASLLLFFTNPGLTDGCYSQGETWDSIATGDSLDTALNELCERMTGTFDIGSTVRKCHNVGSNRINAAIYIMKGPGRSINVKVTKGTCFSLLRQVNDGCPTYGGVMHYTAGPYDDGGEYIEALVNSDPNHGTRGEC